MLKPPGGGSSDIFGGSIPSTPRTVRNNMASTIFAPSNDSKNGNGNGKQYFGNNPQIKPFSFCYRLRVDILITTSRVFVLLWKWLYRGYSICINNDDPHLIFLINLFYFILCAPSTPENYNFWPHQLIAKDLTDTFSLVLYWFCRKLKQNQALQLIIVHTIIIAISSQYTTNQFVHSANKTVAIILFFNILLAFRLIRSSMFFWISKNGSDML